MKPQNKIGNIRVAWIDWAKFLLIWMMVWGHAGLAEPGRSFIYAFHIPAFFIISGYLYKPRCWKRTLVSLGVPVLLFSLLFIAFAVIKMYLKGTHYGVRDIAVNIFPTLYRRNYGGGEITPFTGLWFIETLFFIRLLLGDITRFTFIRRNYKVIMAILILYCSLKPLYADYLHSVDDLYAYKVLSCMPFMMVGLYLKEVGDRWLSLNAWQLLILSAVYIVMTLCNIDVDIYYEHFGRNYLYTFVNAAVASILFFNLLRRLPHSRWAEVLSVGTLLVLGMHSMILQSCHAFASYIGLPNISFVASLVVIVMCYPLIVLTMRHCPLLIGKR